MTDLKALRKKTDRWLEEWQVASATVAQEREALEEAQAHLEAVETALKVLQDVAQTVQQQAHAQVSAIVSQCLEAVFEAPYEFRLVFEQKRSKTEARLVFLRNGEELDPLTAAGGGVVDVAAFALRLACLVLTRPPLRRLLVLDEPFRFVSQGYRGRIRDLLEALSDQLQVQIIMVTHIPELQVGTVVTLS